MKHNLNLDLKLNEVEDSMSRIEKAIEKAVEMRKTVKKADVPQAPISEHKTTFTGFEVGETVIDMNAVDMHLVCITNPNSPAAEQYKKLRARILKATAKEFHNTIMIISPDIGEGKTITAINLAVAMGNEIDYTALLVDADLKHPSIHKYLGIKAEYGLSDYLMGKANLPDILIKTGIGKLVLLPAGSSTDNAAELLSSERMKNLVQELKHRYKDRYIIFDSSPALVVADALSLSSYMDGIVLVAQAVRTTPNAALNTLSLIKGSNILGVVFNNVPKDLAKNLYPYYYLYEDKGYHQKSKEG